MGRLVKEQLLASVAPPRCHANHLGWLLIPEVLEIGNIAVWFDRLCFRMLTPNFHRETSL